MVVVSPKHIEVSIDEFPTTSEELDILKYRATSVLQDRLLLEYID